MDIVSFSKRFPDDDVCLEYLLKQKKVECCKRLYRMRGRRKYACQCGDQYSPTKGTIFHRSKLPLTKWFFAVYLMSQTRHGISSYELARHLDITNAAAFRMAGRIRSVMGFTGRKLRGDVEIDETYHGGVRKGKRGRGADGKTPILGMVERGGRARLTVIPNVRARTLLDEIHGHVHSHATVHTDEFRPYTRMRRRHRVISHSSKVYVDGDTHTNTIEGLWSHVKRGIRGTHVTVSPRHLQSYADQFSFMWNARLQGTHPFWLILEKCLDPPEGMG